MRIKNYIMAAAAVMAMTAGVSAANALDITQSTTSTDIAVSRAATNLSSVAASTTNVITQPTAPVVAFTVGDIITIKVNGAKFNRTNLGATPVTMTTTGGTAAVATWVLNTANSILTGTITGASTNSSTDDGFTLAGAYDLTGIAAGTKITLTSTVSRKVLGVNQVIDKIATTATDTVVFNTTKSLQKFAAITSTPATATVASSFIKLDNSASNVAVAAITVKTLATTLSDASAASATGTLFVKLTGVPLTATKVDWALTGISQSNATGTAAPATATSAGNFWLDGAGNAYAKLASANSNAAISLTDLVITLKGVAAILPSTTKMAVNYIAGGSDFFVSHSVLAPTTIATIVRNGSSFSVNAAGPLNTIKITDMSGSLTATTGTISVVAYDAAGALAAGTAPTMATLKSNSTTVIPMSDLTIAYPTAVRFDFAVASSKIIASNVKKTAKGTTLTVYTNISNSGTL